MDIRMLNRNVIYLSIKWLIFTSLPKKRKPHKVTAADMFDNGWQQKNVVERKKKIALFIIQQNSREHVI